MNVKDTVLISAGTFLIIIGAYIAIPIGPVPVVLTNFFIILVGLLLGWKKSLIIILTYFILGVIGLPVFSGGRGGIAHVLGLTGGFLVGFIPLAFLSGLAANRSIIIKFILTVIGTLMVYAIGVPWAMFVYNNIIAPGADKPLWDLGTTLKYTTIPFLIPGLIKIVAAVILSVILTPVLKPFIQSDNE